MMLYTPQVVFLGYSAAGGSPTSLALDIIFPRKAISM